MYCLSSVRYHSKLFYICLHLKIFSTCHLADTYLTDTIWQICTYMHTHEITTRNTFFGKHHRREAEFLSMLQEAYDTGLSHFLWYYFWHGLKWCLPGFSAVKLLVCPLYSIDILLLIFLKLSPTGFSTHNYYSNGCQMIF